MNRQPIPEQMYTLNYYCNYFIHFNFVESDDIPADEKAVKTDVNTLLLYVQEVVTHFL